MDQNALPDNLLDMRLSSPKSGAIPSTEQPEGSAFIPSDRRAPLECPFVGVLEEITPRTARGWLRAATDGLDAPYVALKFAGVPVLYARPNLRDHEFTFDLTVDIFRNAVLRQIASSAAAATGSVTWPALAATRFSMEFEVAGQPGVRLAVPKDFGTERSAVEWLDFLDADPEAVEALRRAQVTRRGLTPRPEVESESAKFIAFYLPQFHPIPENDAAWGPGFTEWVGVTSNKPRYPDHAAPAVPADLGFYDLRLREVRQQQGELAKAYGIYGFCYYFYWFSGRRLLERPVDLMLRERAPDLPFCLCWANEPWSRRWDGSTDELLVSQQHSKETDVAILEDVLPFLADDRYIRIDGKPLFLIYRMSLMPDPGGFVEAFRAAAARAGLPGLFLCNVMTFGDTDGRAWGCDAAVEFPPHNISGAVIPKDQVGAFESYQGNIYDYVNTVQVYVARRAPEFPFFPGVMPRWDNTARKGDKGNILHGATPEVFEIWLRHSSRVSLQRNPEAPLVFINSWNEWGEGAHIEPDRRFGRAFLEAIRRVSAGDSGSPEDGNPCLGDDAETASSGAGTAHREWSLAARENTIIARHLGSLLPLAAPDPIFGGEPPSIRDLKRVRSTVRSCSIDTCNGRRVVEAPAFRGHGRSLVQGWLCGDLDAGAHPTTVAFLVFRRVPDGLTYHTVILWRLRRPDVATVLGLPDGGEFVGFSIDVDFSTVKPGIYDISLIEITKGAAVEVYAERMIVVG